MKRYAVFVAVALIGMSLSCERTTRTVSGKNEAAVMFYNVENLFDTNNDPNTNDDDFTPEGKFQWNTERFNTKLDRIAQVITTADSMNVAAVGLCEIENRSVLEALVAHPSLANKHFGIVHRDSPDERGIDVAFLYDQTQMSLISEEYLTITLDSGDRTRDILHAVMKWKNDEVHFFVNHWPSRSGGKVETEKDRVAAALVLRNGVNSISEKSVGAKTICMGDFNDHPEDKSIRETLGAGPATYYSLYNCMSSFKSRNKGSHWYKGEWGALDQFMVSREMADAKKGWRMSSEADTFSYEFLFFTDNKNEKRPNRTYAGDSYKAGYSDHLPIYLRFYHQD